MAERVGPAPVDVVIKFGGGLHTRAPEDEIDEREAADGYNFNLDAENSDLRPRPPFTLLGTAPNAASINGGGSFRKSDGTVKAFFQAGANVYNWDGDSFDASPVLDTVNANAKLRGHWRSHAWDLDGLLLISDLALLEPVMEWNGDNSLSTDWQDVAFRSTPSTAFGSAVHCKYINVADERVFYCNIKNGSTTLGHMIVGSERSDYEEISVSDRPASSLGESDPFFLLTPDLRKINGFVEAFGARIVSTEHGRLFNLTGASAKDFAFDEFFPGSAASGDESLAYIGTDIIYGRQGRVEAVKDTDRFGDTEADDLTKGVLDDVKAYTGWTTVYNSRLNRVYLFPTGGSEVWVFDTVMLNGQRSPWMRWRTSHALAFQPTFVMSMLDPLDGLEYVIMGDSTGKIYKLEGDPANTDGDGGTTAIQTQYISKLFTLPLGAKAFEIEGYIKYRKGAALDVSLELEFSGEQVFDEPIVVSLPAVTGAGYYSDGLYYTDGNYYGVAFLDRLVRQKITFGGGDSNEFQLRVSVTSKNKFTINEIGLRFSGTS
jgi:hypothetical protein